jgi:hypothetical protein
MEEKRQFSSFFVDDILFGIAVEKVQESGQLREYDARAPCPTEGERSNQRSPHRDRRASVCDTPAKQKISF